MGESMEPDTAVDSRGWTRELKSMRVGYPRIPAFAVPNTRVFRSSAPLWDFMYSAQI